MTQSTHAQNQPSELALPQRATARNLAQQRAAFAAQMRDMALSDLKQVSERLKGHHKELERVDGRKWTHYELAQKMGIPPRTFQSWENGEVENSDGKGYDKMARFYSRKLGRKITRQWIVFGETPAAAPKPPSESPLDALSGPNGSTALAEQVAELQSETAELRSELALVRTDLQDVLSLLRRDGRGRAGTGTAPTS